MDLRNAIFDECLLPCMTRCYNKDNENQAVNKTRNKRKIPWNLKVFILK